MPTEIKIPTSWIKRRDDVRINRFLENRGLTVQQRVRNNNFWIVTVEENLTAAQRTALGNILTTRLNSITVAIV